jgi:hypothetical protein
MRRRGTRLLHLIWCRRDSPFGFKSFIDHFENERDRYGTVNLRPINEKSWRLAYPKLDTRTDTSILLSSFLLLDAGIQLGFVNVEHMTFVRDCRIELLLGFDQGAFRAAIFCGMSMYLIDCCPIGRALSAPKQSVSTAACMAQGCPSLGKLR